MIPPPPPPDHFVVFWKQKIPVAPPISLYRGGRAFYRKVICGNLLKHFYLGEKFLQSARKKIGKSDSPPRTNPSFKYLGYPWESGPPKHIFYSCIMMNNEYTNLVWTVISIIEKVMIFFRKNLTAEQNLILAKNDPPKTCGWSPKRFSGTKSGLKWYKTFKTMVKWLPEAPDEV